MFFRANDVLGISLPGPEKGLYLALAIRANDKGVCWPSLKTLAADTGYSISTIRTNIQKLIDRGLLYKKQGGGRRSATYVVAPDTQGTESYHPGYRELIPWVSGADTEEDFEGLIKEDMEGESRPAPFSVLLEGKVKVKVKTKETNNMKIKDIGIANIEEHLKNSKKPGVNKVTLSAEVQALWRDTLLESGETFVKGLKDKDKASLKRIAKGMGPGYQKAFRRAILNWPEFMEYCRNQAGVKVTLVNPAIWFLLKYYELAVSYTGSEPILLTEQATIEKMEPISVSIPSFLKED